MSASQSVGSITHCVRQLRAGDPNAAQQLWQSYFCRLVALARGKLAGRVRLIQDEEDVALSAFHSFCRGIERGRYPQLDDRGDLWNLLVTITLHKVLHLVRDETRAKRGGGQLPLALHSNDSDLDLLGQLVESDPTPAMVAELAEQAERLLRELNSPELVELALLKMEGYSNAEVAEKWGKTERTVERKLNLIRQIWDHRSTAPTDPAP